MTTIRKHLLPQVIEEAQRKYQKHIESLADEIVDELRVLDEIIIKSQRIFHSFDIDTTPRLVEVWMSTLLRAIKLKSELKVVHDPAKKIFDELFGSLYEVETDVEA